MELPTDSTFVLLAVIYLAFFTLEATSTSTSRNITQ
jgi:hypothetical protein